MGISQRSRLIDRELVRLLEGPEGLDDGRMTRICGWASIGRLELEVRIVRSETTWSHGAGED
jgi:hypothetical protein